MTSALAVTGHYTQASGGSTTLSGSTLSASSGVDVQAGGVLAGSGTISVNLEKGKSYVIGVVVAGAVSAYYSDTSAIALQPLSFGQASDPILSSVGTSAPATMTYTQGVGATSLYERFTTTKP